MEGSEERITRSIAWLCDNASPPVKYLTHRHLLGASPDSQPLKDLWHGVENCDDAMEIFSKQHDDGSWYSGGSWANKPTYLQKGGYTPYSPKYATTIWILILLGDMGFDSRDPRVRKACEFTMGFLHPDGTFGNFAKSHFKRKSSSMEPPNIPCHFAGYLTGLSKVGMGADPRLDKSFDLLLRWQRPDGGWLNERHLTGEASPYKVWTRSCPFVTYFACQALRHSRRAGAKKPLRLGLSYMAQHLATKRAEELQRFFYHGHETVKELLLFSEEGTVLDPTVEEALLGWLLGLYDRETGRYHYEGRPISKRPPRRIAGERRKGHSPGELKYRHYHMIEDDWLTYYVTSILRNLRSRAATSNDAMRADGNSISLQSRR